MNQLRWVTLAILAIGSFASAQTPHPDPPIVSSSPTSTLKEIERDLEAGRYQQAEAKSQTLLKTHPNHALAWTFLGMASIRLQQADQAIQAFENAIALNPKDSRPYLDVALLYAAQNKLDKAIDRYQKGLSIENRNGTAYYNYGRLLIVKGNFAEAIDALQHSLQLNPADTQARTALVEAFLQARQGQQAAEQVRQLLEKSDVPASALASLGALLVRGGELELARTALTRALSLAPISFQVHLEFSRLYLAANKQEEAVQEAKRAVELAPASLEANLALAEAFISGKQNLQALDLLLKLQPQFEDSAALHYTLGIAQFRVNRYQPAIAAFKKAVRLDPSLDLAHFLLGNACLSTGDLQQAESSLKTAISVNPKNVLYYNYLAQVYERKGANFRGAALENTQRALALDPKDVQSRERLARWARDDGDLVGARARLEQVVADDPTYISARVLLASIYYRLNLRQEGDEQQKIIRSLEAEVQKKQSGSKP